MGGGVSSATHAVSGAPGSERKEANTSCAQRLNWFTACPTPAKESRVEFGSVRAAVTPVLGGVTASKLPETGRVGMLLRVVVRRSLRVFGTPQAGSPHQRVN